MSEPRLLADLIREVTGYSKCWNCGTVAKVSGTPPVCANCENDPTKSCDYPLLPVE
jgi:hypothetical protein